MPQESFDKPISGDALKKALQKFDFLGQSAKELFIEDLESQGVVFDDQHFYTLKELNNIFTHTFGKEITTQLTYRLVKILQEMQSNEN